MLKKSVPTMAIVAVILATAGAAQAGGVIIDGRAPGAPAPDATSNSGSAAGQTDLGVIPSTSPTPAPSGTPQATLTPTEQQIYLLAALVLNSHDAATAPGAPSSIIDAEALEIDDGMGGCSAAPVPALAVLAIGLLLLRRRRV